MGFANDTMRDGYDRLRINYEIQHRADKVRESRESIIELSRTNALVAACFQYWRQSRLSWEEMLTLAGSQKEIAAGRSLSITKKIYSSWKIEGRAASH